jgi:hypothetical protein
MDETTPQDSAENEPSTGETGADQDRDREFDPAEVEKDPSQDPPISELKDLKGG